MNDSDLAPLYCYSIYKQKERPNLISRYQIIKSILEDSVLQFVVIAVRNLIYSIDVDIIFPQVVAISIIPVFELVIHVYATNHGADVLLYIGNSGVSMMSQFFDFIDKLLIHHAFSLPTFKSSLVKDTTTLLPATFSMVFCWLMKAPL